MRTYYIYLYSQVNKLCLAQRTHYIYFYSQVNTLSCTKDSLYIFIQSGKTLRLVQWTHLLLYSLPWELQSYLGYKTAYLIVYTYITLLDNHTVHIQFLNVMTLFLWRMMIYMDMDMYYVCGFQVLMWRNRQWSKPLYI